MKSAQVAGRQPERQRLETVECGGQWSANCLLAPGIFAVETASIDCGEESRSTGSSYLDDYEMDR